MDIEKEAEREMEDLLKALRHTNKLRHLKLVDGPIHQDWLCKLASVQPSLKSLEIDGLARVWNPNHQQFVDKPTLYGELAHALPLFQHLRYYTERPEKAAESRLNTRRLILKMVNSKDKDSWMKLGDIGPVRREILHAAMGDSGVGGVP